jgi:hypothetical protein
LSSVEHGGSPGYLASLPVGQPSLAPSVDRAGKAGRKRGSPNRAIAIFPMTNPQALQCQVKITK